MMWTMMFGHDDDGEHVDDMTGACVLVVACILAWLMCGWNSLCSVGLRFRLRESQYVLARTACCVLHTLVGFRLELLWK